MAPASVRKIAGDLLKNSAPPWCFVPKALTPNTVSAIPLKAGFQSSTVVYPSRQMPPVAPPPPPRPNNGKVTKRCANNTSCCVDKRGSLYKAKQDMLSGQVG